MVILSVHNFYQQPGGEDEVFRQEAQLLEEHGHQVVRYQAHNNHVAGKTSVELLATTIFNTHAYRQVRDLIKKNRVSLVHVHNTFPLLSPGVYYAALQERVPVVQTLHNYRLLCPAAVLFRSNKVCERCLETRSLWPAIRHGCYRGTAASTATAAMLTIHRALETYKKRVNTYIALSEFERSKYIQGGFPPEKIVVKPNFISPDPGKGAGTGKYCMFVGRLTHEKGILTALEAWQRYCSAFDLEVAGNGDLAPQVASAAAQTSKIRWLGRMQKAELYQRMRNAAALIVPSTWYEPFGVVVAEAFAMGVPVIASKIGALTTLVDHGRTGLHFEPGNPADLAAQVEWLSHHPQEFQSMRDAARTEFETCYTGERNYDLLMDIYAKVLGTKPRQDEAWDELQTEEARTLVQIAR
jgi:glycosyltransferase involved in cell wall biosynthesis